MAVPRESIRTVLRRHITNELDRTVLENDLMELLAQKGENPPVYEVVRMEAEHGSEYFIFWRDHKDITQGDHEVLNLWGAFGIDANKAKHTADILNGKFPAL